MHSERSTAGCSLRKRRGWPQAAPGSCLEWRKKTWGDRDGLTLLVYSGSEKETFFIFSMSSVVKSFKLLNWTKDKDWHNWMKQEKRTLTQRWKSHWDGWRKNAPFNDVDGKLLCIRIPYIQNRIWGLYQSYDGSRSRVEIRKIRVSGKKAYKEIYSQMRDIIETLDHCRVFYSFWTCPQGHHRQRREPSRPVELLQTQNIHCPQEHVWPGNRRGVHCSFCILFLQ